MPNPKEFDTEKSWMSACMTQAKKEGLKHDQSVAMCLNRWRERDNKKCASEILRDAAQRIVDHV